MPLDLLMDQSDPISLMLALLANVMQDDACLIIVYIVIPAF